MFETPDTKTCTRCGRTLPADGFSRDRRSRDGRQPWCKDCQREANRRYRERLRARNAENPADLEAPKRCGHCGETKPGHEFHRNRSSTDGLHWTCKECNRKPPERRPPYDAEQERVRHYRKYGLSLEDLRRMLEDQDGRCAICRTPFDDGLVPHVDHCHDTGNVRGLLCIRCNTGIGLLRDDPERLVAAIQYLERPPADAA